MTALAFALVAGLGALTRAEIAGRLNRPGLPAGTLFVNLTGSFALGLLAGAADSVALLAGTGLLAGYTTFSSFAREVADLGMEQHRWSRAGIYLGATLAGGIGAAWLGLAVSA